MPDGSIDGTNLSDEWFQKIQSDIFISHSHNDENLAYALAGWLKDTFGTVPKIRYKIPLNHLNELDADILYLWEENYQEQGTNLYRIFSEMSKHPLNFLYNIVSEKSE